MKQELETNDQVSEKIKQHGEVVKAIAKEMIHSEERKKSSRTKTKKAHYDIIIDVLNEVRLDKASYVIHLSSKLIMGIK